MSGVRAASPQTNSPVECRNADDVDISRHLDCERSSEQREMLRTGVRPDRASDTCMCMLGRRASGLTDSRWSRPVVRELFDRSAVAQHRVDGHGVCARDVRPAPATQQLNAFESRFRSYTVTQTQGVGHGYPGSKVRSGHAHGRADANRRRKFVTVQRVECACGFTSDRALLQ